MRFVVLTGGVGGSKLVRGLAELLPAGELTAIVNTGDDFRHLGLHVSPDIDTLLYHLSDKSSVAHGWGREGETWEFMAALRGLGGEDWFALGDGDLALHVLRSARLANGDGLTAITRDFAAAWGCPCCILPMSEDPVATRLLSDEGELAFQHYFVKRQCEPRVQRIDFRGAAEAKPAPGAIEAINAAEAILFAPSNPYLSIDPIISVPAIHEAIVGSDVPVVAISPLIGGKAVKGPTAKLMRELGVRADNDAIAAHYGNLIDGLLIDTSDDAPAGLAVARTNILMQAPGDKVRVAEAALALARAIAGR